MPGLCLLDPDAGVASFVKWNQTAFQTYLLYFAEDALTASYLTTTCHIAEGEGTNAITALRLAVTVGRPCGPPAVPLPLGDRFSRRQQGCGSHRMPQQRVMKCSHVVLEWLVRQRLLNSRHLKAQARP